MDDPATSTDESSTRTSVTIQGNVRVHPQYTVGGWLRNDYAVLDLDQPADEVVLDVSPIAVERPDIIPKVGDTITLVGYGLTGQNCTSASAGKMQVNVQVSEISDATIVFNNTSSYACPGDSGGPALNGRGNIVGVASSADFATNSNYDPTYVAYEWIFGTGRILRTPGRVTLLRVHDVHTGFGPPTDPIDGEVVVQLDTNPDSFLGFALRTDANGTDHYAMLDILRDSFRNNRNIWLEYVVTGPRNGRIIRVIRTP